MLPAWNKFKGSAKGWGGVDFDFFRHRLWPLRTQTVWSDPDTKLVMDLADEGCGGALKTLFGNKRAAAEALACVDTSDPPFSKGEFRSHIAALIKSCQEDGWKETEFKLYVEFLDSERTVDDLTQERDEGTPQDAKKQPSITAATDRFTKLYRGSPLGVRAAVGSWLIRQKVN